MVNKLKKLSEDREISLLTAVITLVIMTGSDVFEFSPESLSELISLQSPDQKIRAEKCIADLKGLHEKGDLAHIGLVKNIIYNPDRAENAYHLIEGHKAKSFGNINLLELEPGSVSLPIVEAEDMESVRRDEIMFQKLNEFLKFSNNVIVLSGSLHSMRLADKIAECLSDSVGFHLFLTAEDPRIAGYVSTRISDISNISETVINYLSQTKPILSGIPSTTTHDTTGAILIDKDPLQQG